MRYEILGRLQVNDGQRAATIGAQKVETLFAVLLSQPNQIVAASQLMDEIWGERLPGRAAAGIHVYVSQLRKFLSRFTGPDTPVITTAPGYVFDPRDGDIDFQLFERLTRLGKKHAREKRHRQAVSHFESALALWRGPVLSGLTLGSLLSGFAVHLTEFRLECTEALIESYLALGRHRELIGRLYSLIAENPLREAFYRQLMLALYRSDRQADALKAYQSARLVLREELGLEPCRALQDLQRSILSADYHLDRFRQVAG
ncbi:AfsR/SARP family transcriptional regulator [Micromonospora sp. RP3T]|uniref:AfsR/SARP family transcriptional regulator n=1 Tax=Micromonospora sp. RP3T TaxID=2135446 RepID=UPI000D152375|nr:AfsR/SARP family transcriptional regulator [Micromonospora sp. RP3T]PTA47671.1 activator protein [Micromonospora sp. RP3T]